MAGEWRKLPFSQAVTVNPRVQLTRGATYPFVDMGAVSAGSRSAYASEQRQFDGGGSRFAVGDTLMARITPCLENGKIARFAGLPGEIGHGSTEFIVIRGRDGVSDTDFAYYLTKWEGVSGYAISQMTGTSGRRRVPSEALDHLKVLLPPLSEQRAIAHILGTLDDKIELNRKMNETLEAMARALFKAWFVDFEPVRAKLEGRWRRGQSLPGMPAHLYDLFPERLVESELGEIPEGWKFEKLGNFIEIHDSCRVPLSSKQRAQRKGPYPYHGAAGIIDSIDDFLFEGIYVLLGEDGSVIRTDGRPYTQYVWGKFWVNNHAHVLRGRGISNETLLIFLDQCNIAPFVTGAVQPKLSQDNLKAIPFLNAGQALLKKFEEFAEPLFAQIRDATEESRTLAQLRDTLLPKLISGKLRVPDAERIVGAAV